MEENFKLKEIINPALVGKMASDIKAVWPGFKQKAFQKKVVEGLNPLSFSERAHWVMLQMAAFLPADYPTAIQILQQSFGPEQAEEKEEGDYSSFYYWPHAKFVEHYGLDHFDLSIKALYEITKRFTAEFSIRAFITRYPEKMMTLLHQWVEDDNHHVRRLVSEGSRPRLPWAGRLPQFQQDPQPVIELLEKLREDPELYVRRSVANNLNDIAKDHPEIVVEVLNRWSQIDNPDTQWIIKHAARTLIKSGHTEVLSLLGYSPNVNVSISDFEVDPQVKQGEKLHFSFTLTSHEKRPINLMIDYLVYFMKANGEQKPKVFKLAKKTLKPGESLILKKTQSFRPISTRVYYPGTHGVEIQVNGKLLEKKPFKLI